MSVLGAERQNWRRAILALAICDGPPADLVLPLEKTRPLTSSVSSMVPPICSTIRMSRRSTLVAAAASSPSRPRTESTAMGARRSEFCDTTLEERQVLTAEMREGRSARSTGRDMSRMAPVAMSAAFMKLEAMAVGWMPLDRSIEQASRRAPATTTTVVVPSPASMSCDWDSSTSILAAGWRTFILDRIVAPSLLMRTSPSGICISLSIPRGPSEVRTALATALAATMLDVRTSFPLDRSCSVSPVLKPMVALRYA
mmetsp:Transcript_30154/g.88180  ORF Transcript_30154/g.88180 Transcript_30154/m.88180 type:complete len:256 (+) Transcript_30154:4625-5392(+)